MNGRPRPKRETVGKLAYDVGRGCAELHDRLLVGILVNRIECDELWAYVGHKRNPQKGPVKPSFATGDQYTFIALGASSRAIIAYRTGKRDTEMTDQFIQDLRQRVIGAPEISTDGWHPYKNAIRDAFNKRAAHGVINKTYSVTHLNVTEASRRYAGSRSSRRAGSRNGRTGANLDKLRGTSKPHAAHGVETICAALQWL
jgi:IS1 family transposase